MQFYDARAVLKETDAGFLRSTTFFASLSNSKVNGNNFVKQSQYINSTINVLLYNVCAL